MKISPYRERLILARTHAGLNQSELAKKINLKPQAIQHLEDPKKKAVGSKHTTAIARACGVSAEWLAEERGDMLPTTGLIRREMVDGEAESAAKITAEELKRLAEHWTALPPKLRAYTLRKITMLREYADSLTPLLRNSLNPPDDVEEYFAWERALESEMRAMKKQVAAAK